MILVRLMAILNAVNNNLKLKVASLQIINNKMFFMERHESFQEKLEPLLNTPPTKQEQVKQYLKQFIQQYQAYQTLIQPSRNYFVGFFTIHIICLIAFHLKQIKLLPNATIIEYLFVLPDLFWAVGAFFFNTAFYVEDPHLLGTKRIKLIIAIKPTQLYSIGLTVIGVFIMLRNVFISQNYILLLLDMGLGLLAFRIILQIYNREAEVCGKLDDLRQREFYLIPVVQAQVAQEPFQVEQIENDRHVHDNQKSFKVSFQKYYKPVRRKDNGFLNVEQELQCQLYSH